MGWLCLILNFPKQKKDCWFLKSEYCYLSDFMWICTRMACISKYPLSKVSEYREGCCMKGSSEVVINEKWWEKACLGARWKWKKWVHIRKIEYVWYLVPVYSLHMKVIIITLWVHFKVNNLDVLISQRMRSGLMEYEINNVLFKK